MSSAPRAGQNEGGSEAGWALWQFTRKPAPQQGAGESVVDLVYLRDVGTDEVERIRGALQLVGEMNGQYLIGPFIRSANRVRTVIEHVREAPGARAMDIEVQLELGMALDEWLVSTNSFRRRTEREVRRCLGDAAGDAAQARFQDLYDHDVDFRLVWEWRNAAQHRINPVAITRLTAGRVASQPEVRWLLDGARAQACAFRWPPSMLAHMTPNLDYLVLMERVVKRVQHSRVSGHGR